MHHAELRATLLGAVLVVLCSPARADTETWPTNYELVVEAARQASTELAGGLEGLGLSQSLGVRSVGKHAGSFLVENALCGALAKFGHAVRTRPDSTGPVLEFEVVDLGLAYTRVHRSKWGLGEKRVDREARARLFARLVDEDEASIQWADQAEARIRDVVPRARLDDLEEKSPADYLKAELPGRSWNKLVEPVVVTGIVVGLIVLFFSNQTTSN